VRKARRDRLAEVKVFLAGVAAGIGRRESGWICRDMRCRMVFRMNPGRGLAQCNCRGCFGYEVGLLSSSPEATDGAEVAPLAGLFGHDGAGARAHAREYVELLGKDGVLGCFRDPFVLSATTININHRISTQHVLRWMR
jgi:hypothetical protein